MSPDPTPCELPAWPEKINLGDRRPLDGGAFVPQAGLADIGRFVKGATAYYDANERCRKARAKR